MEGQLVLGRREGHELFAPPGCSGAKSVISYTVLSTTIHRSSATLCLEISWARIVRVMMGRRRKGLM